MVAYNAEERRTRYQNNKQKVLEQARMYYQDNRQKIREYQRKRREKNALSNYIIYAIRHFEGSDRVKIGFTLTLNRITNHQTTLGGQGVVELFYTEILRSETSKAQQLERNIFDRLNDCYHRFLPYEVFKIPQEDTEKMSEIITNEIEKINERVSSAIESQLDKESSVASFFSGEPEHS